MRIGIFGGSFDPIHTGHLILAEQCREQAALDQVLFIPSAQAPHKEAGAFGTDRQRTEMIDLAIGGHPSFLRSSIEIERGGVSYTVDTLEQLKQERPDVSHMERSAKDSGIGDATNNGAARRRRSRF